MNTDIVMKIFENSKHKQIDICSHGQFALQFRKVSTEVSNEGNGTIAVKETARGCVTYIDCTKISSIWVNTDEEKKEDNPFID